MAEPLKIDHVMRPPLPWRPEADMRTECGLPPAGHPIIDRAAFLDRVKQLGKQRAAMVTCMTCFDTALRYPTWEQSPVGALNRETTWFRSEKTALFERELKALAALVARHRDEFSELLKDQEDIVPIRSAKRRPPPAGEPKKW